MSKKKLLCFTLSIIFFISLISFKQIIIKADVINMPKFDVEMSVNPTSVVVGQNVTISGTIYPKEFTLNSMPAKPRDIVVVIDRRVESNGAILPLLNGLKSFFDSIKNDEKYEGSRVGFISYNQDATIYKESNNSLINLRNYTEIEKILNSIENDVKKNIKEDRKSNIGEALRKAESILYETESNSESDKIIILVSNNKSGARTSYINGTLEGDYYTDITKADISEESEDHKKVKIYTGVDDRSFQYSKKIGEIIKKNGHKIFTISYLETDENVTKQLKELHESIIGKSIDDLGQNEKSFFVTKDKDAGNIKNIFSTIDRQTLVYNLDDIQMNLEFNEGFSLDIGGNTVYLDNITYKLISTEEEKNNNEYKYAAEPIDFEFEINTSKVGKEQEIFSSIYITYTWQGEEVKENIILDISIKVDVRINYTGPDIRILEIEPADSFRLSDIENTRVTTGKEIIKRNKNNKEYKIEITHMTMAEFISSVEQLNGKYDVIVIGRYVDQNLFLSNGTLESNTYNQWYNKQGTTWFRDYSNLDNDITDKKAKEIKEFIDSGQIVYIDKEIGNMNSSKIYYHTTNPLGNFNQDVENLIKNLTINGNNGITINNILDKYIDLINNNSHLVRQNIISNYPKGDSYDYELGDINKRNMTFEIVSNELLNEDLTINLYLDMNGDGLFKEDEIVKTEKNINLSNGIYKLEYNMYNDYPDFIGYLDWRIEAVKEYLEGYSEPIKTYYDGNILFRRLTQEKKVINVLQVSHLSKYDLNNYYTNYENNGVGTSIATGLSLATDTEFQNLLSQEEVKDYEVNIDIINYMDFYKNESIDGWMQSKYVDIFNYVNNVKLSESKYSVIIIGFNSNYDTGILSDKAVEELKEYTAEGKSLILTHDTVSTKSEELSQASNFVKTFRDTIGQSRYLDPNNETNDYNNKTSIGINGNIIEHDSDDSKDISKKTTSSTLLSLYSESNFDNSTKIWKVNRTALTSYPFELGDEIEVRITNHQHFQLNLEDENVVPMLNLTEYNSVNTENLNPHINRYDARNSYYAYSKDNITFSSLGETERGNTDQYKMDELKLFVNTIIKSDRLVNNKKNNNSPKISGLEYFSEIPYEEEFKFDIKIEDIDNDKIKLNKVLVNGQDITKENNVGDGYKDSGHIYNLFIKSYLLSKENSEVTITLEAEDEKGAKSIKEYKIKLIDKSIVVAHGIYNGTNSGPISIHKNTGDYDNPYFKIAQGSTVTFAANFTFSGSSIEFNLNVDNKFSTINPNYIKIYKVSKDSSGNTTLENLDNNKSISTSESNKFKISISNMKDSSTEILVVYQGKIIDGTAPEQKLTNEIVFGSTSESVTIVTPKQSIESPVLPELF